MKVTSYTFYNKLQKFLIQVGEVESISRKKYCSYYPSQECFWSNWALQHALPSHYCMVKIERYLQKLELLISIYHGCLWLIYDILIRHACPLTAQPEFYWGNSLALFRILWVQNTIRKIRKTELIVRNIACTKEPESDAASRAPTSILTLMGL